MTDFQNIPNNNDQMDTMTDSNQVFADTSINSEQTQQPTKKSYSKVILLILLIVFIGFAYFLYNSWRTYQQQSIFNEELNVVFDNVSPTQDDATSAPLTLTRQEEYEMTYEKIKEGIIQYEGGDGLSIENSIVITGANNTKEGIASEYLYLMEKYGQKGEDFFLLEQSTLTSDDRTYDYLEIEISATNEILNYYFDITDFFGKW